MIVRINDYALAKIEKRSESVEFNCLKVDGGKQYFTDADTDKIIWRYTDYKYHLNSLYSKSYLGTDIPNELVDKETHDSLLVTLYVRDTAKVFGFSFAAQSLESNTFLVSQCCVYFSINFYENVLIDGTFWSAYKQIIIPDLGEKYQIGCEAIPFDSVFDNGLISTDLNRFVPTVTDEITPNNIYVDAKLTDNGFMNIRLVTRNNNSVETTILEHFRFNNAAIDIRYEVSYGNEDIGFKVYEISNRTNIFSPVEFALPLSINTRYTLYVRALITVNNALMTVDTLLVRDFVSEPLQKDIYDRIKVPDTLYPVDVKIENVINQQVIETKTEREAVIVYQPVFSEIVTEPITYDRSKNVTFKSLINYDESLTMEINSNTFISKQTVDGITYFELKDLIFDGDSVPYVIYKTSDGTLVGNGTIIKK